MKKPKSAKPLKLWFRKPMRLLTLALQGAISHYSGSHRPGKLSADAALIVYLIREDMRSHRFFSALREVGLDDTFHQPELSSLILAYLGFTKGKDPCNFYFDLLDRHSKRTKAGSNSLSKEAINNYCHPTKNKI
jgi:hypothetical protein